MTQLAHQLGLIRQSGWCSIFQWLCILSAKHIMFPSSLIKAWKQSVSYLTCTALSCLQNHEVHVHSVQKQENVDLQELLSSICQQYAYNLHCFLCQADSAYASFFLLLHVLRIQKGRATSRQNEIAGQALCSLWSHCK